MARYHWAIAIFRDRYSSSMSRLFLGYVVGAVKYSDVCHVFRRLHGETQVPRALDAAALCVLPGASASAEATPDEPSPATAGVRLRNISPTLMSSHLHQRRSPRKICLRRRMSGTNPS